MVLMMLPIAFVELLEELEFDPPRSAIELSTKDEIVDWVDSAVIEDDVPDVPEELEVLPVRALIKLWNIELRLEVTLLEAPEPVSRLPSNSLLADSVARLVSAATVEAVLAGVLAGVAEAWLLLTLPIDIMAPIAIAGIRGIGRCPKNLRRVFCSRPEPKWEICAGTLFMRSSIGADEWRLCTTAD
jgi:hypothetical protein